MNSLPKFKYWLPVILAMAFIFWMSTESFSEQNTSGFIQAILRFFVPAISRHQLNLFHAALRKAAHITEYLVLGMLLFRAFRAGSPEWHSCRWALSALACIVLYAASDEFHQSFTTTRTSSVIDVGYDTLGGFIGQCISVVWHYKSGWKDRGGKG